MLRLGRLPALPPTRSTDKQLRQVRRVIEGDLDVLESTIAALADVEQRGYTATLDFPVNLFAKALAELRSAAART